MSFKMQDFFYYSDIVRPSNNIAIEKIICYSKFPKGGGTPSHPGPYRKGPGSRGKRRKRKSRERVFIMVFMGRNRRDRVSGVGRFKVS